MREEIAALKAGGAKPGDPSAGGDAGDGGGVGSDPAADAEMRAKMADQDEIMKAFEKERQEYAAKIAAVQAESKIRSDQEERLKSTPQIRNINQDQAMSGMFKFALPDGDSYIGKKNKDFTPQVPLSGVGIANKQCSINYDSEEKTAMLSPNEDDPAKYPVKINGERIESPKRLLHGDRILIGSHHYYLYVDPLIDNTAQCDWETAMKEANKDQMNLLGNDDDYDKQLAEMEEKLRAENSEKQKQLEEQKEKLEAQRKEQEARIAQQMKELQESGANEDESRKKLLKEQEEFEAKMRERQL